MAMPTTGIELGDASLLQLIWLASPALPVGGFSYSEGLESAVDCGLVTNEATAANWLADQLHLSLARADLAALAQAVVAARASDVERLRALDAWVLRTRETSELRQQTVQMGRSLMQWVKSLAPQPAPSKAYHSEPPPPVRPEPVEGPDHPEPVEGLTPHTLAWDPSYPIAFALAAAPCGASVRAIVLAFAFGWAENMAQAAIKSVPLGQGAGQRTLSRLAADMPAAVDHALSLADDERQAFSPMLAILSARHEHQYSRLFRS
jgi:urease accessory protein